MAGRAANPFYIEPSKMDISPVLKGIGSLVKSSREEATKKANADKLMAAYNSGDDNQIAELMANNPELRDTFNSMMEYKNDDTQKSFNKAMRGVLSTNDPEMQREILANRINEVTDAGGEATDSLRLMRQLNEDPEGFQRSMSTVAASLYNKQEMAEFNRQRGIGGGGFKQQEIDIKKGALELRKIESELRQDEIKLKREDNQLNREKMQLDIDAKRERIVRIKKEIQKKAKAEIRQQSSLVDAIDDFIGNDDYINSVTGWRGRSPSVSDVGVEAEAYFDNIKNNLTLENLDKMTGVLSETDIKILSTAATAMRVGMGKPAMLKEMRKIKLVLKDKSAEVQKMILGGDATEKQAGQNEDSQAVEWAKANPNDPRSAQILQQAVQ